MKGNEAAGVYDNEAVMMKWRKKKRWLQADENEIGGGGERGNESGGRLKGGGGKEMIIDKPTLSSNATAFQHYRQTPCCTSELYELTRVGSRIMAQHHAWAGIRRGGYIAWSAYAFVW